MAHRILSIDTATTACSVALFEDHAVVASYYEEIGRGHAEILIPMIARLPNKGRADQIKVNCGPGSFTGVRIGLSAAKALGMAWHAKITGYQCLDLVAAQALAEMEHPAPVYVVMIGGHGEYFVQNFTADGHSVDGLMSLPPEQALQRAKADHFAGSGAEILAKLGDMTSFQTLLPSAEKSALLRNDYRYVEASPVYGREPDAQPAQQVR